MGFPGPVYRGTDYAQARRCYASLLRERESMAPEMRDLGPQPYYTERPVWWWVNYEVGFL